MNLIIQVQMSCYRAGTASSSNCYIGLSTGTSYSSPIAAYNWYTTNNATGIISFTFVALSATTFQFTFVNNSGGDGPGGGNLSMTVLGMS